MPVRIPPIAFLLIALLACGAPSAASFEAVDRGKIHGEYENGNFDTVLKLIHEFQKRNPQCSKEDSVFIAMHLGVVHAANPKTVEVGKYWMHQMLILMPTADLTGMFVNEDIDRIFDKVRREFQAQQAAAAAGDPRLTPRYKPGDAPVDEARAGEGGRPSAALRGENRKWVWIGVGGGALVAAVVAYFVMDQASSSGSGPARVPVEL